MQSEDMEKALRAFQESRILLTAIELNVFTAIAQGATAEKVAIHLRTDPRATAMLLNALVAMDILRRNGDVFENGPLAAETLVDGSPRSARTAMMHTVHRWETWSRLTDRVRGVVSHEDFRELGPDRYEAHLAMQDLRSARRAASLVKAVGTAGVRRILDIGGGSAAYSIAFARAAPGIEAEVLDLPQMMAITNRYIAAAGLGNRVQARPGDMHRDELGSGYDLILLCSVAHLLSEGENRSLLARCRRALAPGGRLAIHDHIMNTDKTAPRTGAVFALNMLLATAGGATYSYEEYDQWLRDAGFATVRRGEMPGPAGVVLGIA